MGTYAAAGGASAMPTRSGSPPAGSPSTSSRPRSIIRVSSAAGGRDPLASFRDSPAVVRGERAGYYRLDPGRRAVLARGLEEKAAELGDLERALATARVAGDDARVDVLRADRRTLAAERKRLEAAAEELAAVFGDDAGA